jgi:hypothetical protein
MATTAPKVPASPFRDLAEFVTEAPPIVLPIKGTAYAFPGTVSGWAYLLCQRMFSTVLAAERAGEAPTLAGLAADLAPDADVLSDMDQPGLERELYGDQRDALYRLDSATIQHVLVTLAAWHALGPEIAVMVWEAPGNRPAPNRAARRAGAKPAGSKTRRRASTSGTTSARTRTASASRGRAS